MLSHTAQWAKKQRKYRLNRVNLDCKIKCQVMKGVMNHDKQKYKNLAHFKAEPVYVDSKFYYCCASKKPQRFLIFDDLDLI